MARNLDREDAQRVLRGEHESLVALVNSNEFGVFMTLILARIERERLALEKDSDAIQTATIRGRIAGLRLIENIITERRTTLTNELRNQGA